MSKIYTIIKKEDYSSECPRRILSILPIETEVIWTTRCVRDVYLEPDPFPGLEDYLLYRALIEFHNPSEKMLARATFIV